MKESKYIFTINEVVYEQLFCNSPPLSSQHRADSENKYILANLAARVIVPYLNPNFLKLVS